ncbi:hypothetical protein PCK1_002557 [Pneumocystis canis]|nr:hypothetical protein PCK1_002557 [Pneumocystis canis]
MGCSVTKHSSVHEEFGEYHQNLQDGVSFYTAPSYRTQTPGCHLCKRTVSCNIYYLSYELLENNSLRPPRPCVWTSDQPITISNLIRRRKEFWETAASYGGSPEIWNTLRLVIETIPVNLTTAQTLINTSKIIIPTGNIFNYLPIL